MKWVQDWTEGSAENSIDCRELLPYRRESHNTFSGNPTFSTRLEVASSDYNNAIRRLLGVPEVWPLSTPFIKSPVCVDVKLSTDNFTYSTDSDAEILVPDFFLLDVTYMVRTGVYVRPCNIMLPLDYRVYIDDRVRPHSHAFPVNNRLLFWGKAEDETQPTDKVLLTPQESPVRYEKAFTLFHHLEGYPDLLSTISSQIGTVNEVDYYSPVLQETFVAGTLLFKNYTAEFGFNNSSYLNGIQIPNVVIEYEYRPDGWKKFARIDPTSGNTVYSHMFTNAVNPELYEPFPEGVHLNWLQFDSDCEES